jgi:hypothetical protein
MNEKVDPDSQKSRRPEVTQLNFEFTGGACDGLALWREQRRDLFRRLSLELGLPLGFSCEVILGTGIQLRGRLELEEEGLFLTATRGDANLRIGKVTFSIAEVVDCVRID